MTAHAFLLLIRSVQFFPYIMFIFLSISISSFIRDIQSKKKPKAKKKVVKSKATEENAELRQCVASLESNEAALLEKVRKYERHIYLNFCGMQH